jgi:hypothetical protein
LRCTRDNESKSSITINSSFWRRMEIVNGKGPLEIPSTKLENTLFVNPTSTCFFFSTKRTRKNTTCLSSHLCQVVRAPIARCQRESVGLLTNRTFSDFVSKLFCKDQACLFIWNTRNICCRIPDKQRSGLFCTSVNICTSMSRPSSSKPANLTVDDRYSLTHFFLRHPLFLLTSRQENQKSIIGQKQQKNKCLFSSLLFQVNFCKNQTVKTLNISTFLLLTVYLDGKLKNGPSDPAILPFHTPAAATSVPLSSSISSPR